MIFKVQRELTNRVVSGDARPLQALVYNKDRSIQFDRPLTNYSKWFEAAGNPMKIYVSGVYLADGKFIITRRVAEQSW